MADILIATDADNGRTPGSIEGTEFRVTPDGAATYAIPLWVPPGRRGIQPRLSLSYHSRGGNGWLGVGWSLSGLSQITRCKRTVADDGALGSIRFDASDPFALDGQRLVLIQGVNGRDGAEYRTKRDSFCKIILHDADEMGPTWFEAFYKDGRIAIFGGVGESDLGSRFEGEAVSYLAAPFIGQNDQRLEIEPIKSQVRHAWGLKSVRDRCGNEMRIYYDKPPTPQGSEREYVPMRIEYTGSPAGDTAALRSVDLVWLDDRPDVQTRFISGLRLVQKKRLRELRMNGPDPVDPGLLRRYVLSYRNDSVTGRSLLATVEELDRSGVAKGSHKFDWELGSAAFRRIDTGIADVATTPPGRSVLPGRLRIADFNGDGCDDILYVPNSDRERFYILLSDPNSATGFSEPVKTPILVPHDVNARPFIFRDSASDWVNIVILDDSVAWQPVFRFYRAGIDRTGITGTFGAFYVYLVKTILVANGGVDGVREVLEVADFDGDGLPDLLRGELSGVDPTWAAYKNLGGNLNFQTVGPATDPALSARGFEQFVVGTRLGNAPFHHYFADLDGDSATSLLIDGSDFSGADPRYANFGLKSINGALVPNDRPSLTTLPLSQQLVFADVHGSGLPSAFIPGRVDQSDPLLAENVGGSFGVPIASNLQDVKFPSGPAGPDDRPAPAVRVFDLDMDGASELLLRWYAQPNAGDPTLEDSWYVLKWNGQSFTQSPLAGPFGGTTKRREEFDMVEVLDYDGNGLDDLVIFSDCELRLYIRDAKKPDVIARIIDGFGARTEIDYLPVSDGSRAVGVNAVDPVYTPAHGFTYPVRGVNGKVWVVSEHRDDDGIGGVNTHRYRYEGGVEDVRGAGLLGFQHMHVLHVETGVETHTMYDLLSAGYPFYPRIGLPVYEHTKVPLPDNRVQLTKCETTYSVRANAGKAPYFVFAQRIEEETQEPGTPIRRRTIVQDADDFGNIVSHDEVWGDGNSSGYSAEYLNSPGTWLIGLLDKITEHSTVPGGTTHSRVRAYEYDDQGLVEREIIEPGTKGPAGYEALPLQPDGVATLFRTLDRFANGNVFKLTEDDGSGNPDTLRVTTWAYDPVEQLFPIRFENALGQSVQFDYHTGLGVIGGIEDENGVAREFQYDEFGRPRNAKSPDGNHVSIHYSLVGGGLRVVRESSDGATVITDYDILGRPITETAIARDNGTATVRDIQYDGLGRAIRVSRPHFVPDPAAYYSLGYDLLGRIISETTPDASTLTREFRGEWITITNANRRKLFLQLDNLDRVIFSAEGSLSLIGTPKGPLGMHFEYGPFNTLISVRDILDNKITTTTDRLGRLLELKDPDRGHHVYAYNIFDELKRETDGIGNVLDYVYDRLGRLTAINDGVNGDTSYTWDTAPNGIGKLASVAVTNGNVVTSYHYDPLGRVDKKSWAIDQDAYELAFTYDGVGRLERIQYPKGARASAFAARTIYGNFGQLLKVVDDGTGLDLWSDGGADASWEFGSEVLGNGLIDVKTEDPTRPGVLKSTKTVRAATAEVIRHHIYGFDANYNLVDRLDEILHVRERFVYDPGDRLHGWTWESQNGRGRVQWDYDNIGNLLRRTIQEGDGKDLICTYDPTVAGPHAVVAVNQAACTYDQNGNQISAPGRQVFYGRMNLPTRLQRTGPNGATTDFVYDGEMTRVRSIDSGAGLTIDSIGGLYEFRRPTGSMSADGDHVCVVPVSARPVARVSWTVVNGVSQDEETHYLHVDHQGSVEMITDAAGQIAERLKYDPFGNRVNPLEPSKPTGVPLGNVRTGFTAHEHVEEWQLIDMQGRFYDSMIGKFLSPDPFVPHPIEPQSWNCYAYALNNPLSRVDWSGFMDAGVVEERVRTTSPEEQLTATEKKKPRAPDPPKPGAPKTGAAGPKTGPKEPQIKNVPSWDGSAPTRGHGTSPTARRENDDGLQGGTGGVSSPMIPNVHPENRRKLSAQVTSSLPRSTSTPRSSTDSSWVVDSLIERLSRSSGVDLRPYIESTGEPWSGDRVPEGFFFRCKRPGELIDRISRSEQYGRVVTPIDLMFAPRDAAVFREVGKTDSLHIMIHRYNGESMLHLDHKSIAVRRDRVGQVIYVLDLADIFAHIKRDLLHR